MTDTFKIDNWLLENAPKTFGARALQLHLPGLEPFGIFDFWATMGLYYHLDTNRPTDPVMVKPTRLLETLEFSRELSDATAGYETFPTRSYQMLHDALHRLYSVEVDWRNFWNVRTGKRGRPRKQWVEYRGRILTTYAYVYGPNVIPPDQLPESKRRNVNKTALATGEPPPPIWMLKNGPKPEGIRYRIAEDLLRGITGDDPHIGATIVPVRIFGLRATFQQYPTATKLLGWTIRQTNQAIKRDLDNLAHTMNMKGKDRHKNRRSLLDYLDLLREAGVIEDLVVDSETVTFTKAADWHFGRRVEREDPSLEGES